MNTAHFQRLLTLLLLLAPGLDAPSGAGELGDGPPVLEGPLGMPRASQDLSLSSMHREPIHEAFLTLGKSSSGGQGTAIPAKRIAQAPPPPVYDPPQGEPPTPASQWVDGYWKWDDLRGDFAWIAGAWRVPPRGKIWVNGVWKRDEQGWYRTPGAWSERKGSAARPAANVPKWRTEGPPTDRPDEENSPAPGPGYFYVPGEYIPEGDGAVWRRGFWAKSVAGWEWVPARWVRVADGWSFREGYWNPVSDEATAGPAAAVANARDRGSNPAGRGSASSTRGDMSRSPFQGMNLRDPSAPGLESSTTETATQLEPIAPDRSDAPRIQSGTSFPRSISGAPSVATGIVPDPLSESIFDRRFSPAGSQGTSSASDPNLVNASRSYPALGGPQFGDYPRGSGVGFVPGTMPGPHGGGPSVPLAGSPIVSPNPGAIPYGAPMPYYPPPGPVGTIRSLVRGVLGAIR